MELEEVLQLALEVLARRAVGGRADDRAAAAQVEALGLAAQALALLVVEAPRDADALAGRRVDHVAPGDRELHAQPRALALQRVLDDLHDDLLAGLDELGDLRAALLAAAAAAADVDARDDDLVDVQEAVLVEADVDERRLEAGQHVVDLALVDVADDRARAAPLEVQLGDPVAGRRVLPSPRRRGLLLFRGARCPGRLQQRDAGLTAIDADQQLLLHERRFLCLEPAPALRGCRDAPLRVHRLQEADGQEGGDHRAAAVRHAAAAGYR